MLTNGENLGNQIWKLYKVKFAQNPLQLGLSLIILPKDKPV